MAFLDFLNQGIGGMSPAQTTPAPMGEGDLVTRQPQPIGPTWGDLVKAAGMYGSRPNSSTATIAAQRPWSANVQMQPLQPTQLMQTPQDKKKAQGGGTDLDAIAKIFMGIFGGV